MTGVASRHVPALVGRLTIAATACLMALAFCEPARASDTAAAIDDLATRAATTAGQIYDVLRERAIEPARRRAEAVLASPVVEQAGQELDQMIRSTVATIDAATRQPLGQTATDMLNSPSVDRARTWAGTAWDDAVACVDSYVVAPLRKLAASARSGDRSSLNELQNALLTAAASVQTTADEFVSASDPLEPVNRWTFALNGGLYSHLLAPVTAFYQRETPPAVQEGIGNFFSNLREPITIASSLLEGDVRDAGNATARFGINTTVGVVGIYDPASSYGFPPRTHNLEEVLCTYSLPAGPYLVLPLYGSATIRDAVGRLATVVAYFQVMGLEVYVPYRLGDAVARSAASGQAGSAPDQRSVDDPYLTQRLLYLDARATDCGRFAGVDADKPGP